MTYIGILVTPQEFKNIFILPFSSLGVIYITGILGLRVTPRTISGFIGRVAFTCAFLLEIFQKSFFPRRPQTSPSIQI